MRLCDDDCSISAAGAIPPYRRMQVCFVDTTHKHPVLWGCRFENPMTQQNVEAACSSWSRVDLHYPFLEASPKQKLVFAEVLTGLFH
jgi:hypothetical protein